MRIAERFPLGRFHLFLVLVICLSPCSTLGGEPNILLIVVDDQGYSDMGITGRAWDVRTPNIDRLAESGVRFEQGYATSGVCSPSRCALLTGVYQQRQGNYWFGGPGMPDKSFPTLAEKLKAAGYATGYIGKSHYGRGDDDPTHRNFPNNHGFDTFFGFTNSRKHYLLHRGALEVADRKKVKAAGNGGNTMASGAMWRNGRKVDVEGFTTELFGEEARTFIKEHKDGPFFLQLSFNAVHAFTHQLPEEYLRAKGLKGYHDWDPATEDYISWNFGGKRPHNVEGRALYLGQLHFLDLEIGRMLDFLDAERLRENTVIVYISDNGGSPATYANNDPLREGKFSLYEGAIRVPYIVSWPGKFAEGAVLDNVVSMLDVYPTLCAAAGVAPGFTDGIDLSPLLTGHQLDLEHDVLVWDMNAETAVRKGKWKLKTAHDLRNAQRQDVNVEFGEYLYDLETDPGEHRDLRCFFPEKFEELKNFHTIWRNEMQLSVTVSAAKLSQSPSAAGTTNPTPPAPTW